MLPSCRMLSMMYVLVSVVSVQKLTRVHKFALKEWRRVKEEKEVVMMEGRLLEMREKELLGRRCMGRS